MVRWNAPISLTSFHRGSDPASSAPELWTSLRLTTWTSPRVCGTAVWMDRMATTALAPACCRTSRPPDGGDSTGLGLSSIRYPGLLAASLGSWTIGGVLFRTSAAAADLASGFLYSVTGAEKSSHDPDPDPDGVCVSGVVLFLGSPALPTVV